MAEARPAEATELTPAVQVGPPPAPSGGGEGLTGGRRPASPQAPAPASFPVTCHPGMGKAREGSDFHPPWWLAPAHLQTIAPALVTVGPPVELRHERHELPDGDFVDLHWVGRERAAPVVVVIPGMQGSERSGCVRSLLAEVQRQGLRAVVLCHRGGHVPNRLPGSYHAGFIEHLAWLVAGLKVRFPESPLHAVGFSLGGS